MNIEQQFCTIFAVKTKTGNISKRRTDFFKHIQNVLFATWESLILEKFKNVFFFNNTII